MYKHICYLFLHRPSGRGSGIYLSYLMDYFKKNNIVSLVSGMQPKPGSLNKIDVHQPHIPFQIPVYQGRADVKKNILLSKIRNSHFNALINLFSRECIRINNKKNISLLHANHCSILPYSSWLVKKETGIPYVVMAHGTGIISSLQSKRNFDTAKIGLINANHVMANSRFVASKVIKEFNISPSKVSVVHLGVDYNEFKPISNNLKEKIKARYGCSKKKIVYSTGFFMQEKGFQDLIQAAKIYEKKEKNIFTLISGKGPYKKELEKLIKKLKLKRTKLIGWVPKEDLLNLYSAADLFITPSRWDEPFGMVTIEAMSSGTPVIGTKTGATPEIITKKTGSLVQPQNPEHLAQAILHKISDKKWLEEAGKRARTLVKSKFSIDIMCKGTEKIYNKLV